MLSQTQKASIAAVLLLWGCGRQPANVLATFDGGTVTVEELETSLSRLPEGRRKPPTGQSMEQWLERRLSELAFLELLRARVGNPPKVEDPAIRLRARYLASQRIMREFLLEHCPAPSLSQEELRTAYERRVSKTPREWLLLRHIYKRADPQSSPTQREQVRAQLEAVRRELLQGASFIELARRHSDSETRDEGGLVGRITRESRIQPRVMEAAWALKDGEISRIVELPDGFHVLLREDSAVEPPEPFEQARKKLERELVNLRRIACAREFMTELGKRKPTVFEQTAIPAATPAATIALKIGDESFTRAQLAGLAPDYAPLHQQSRLGLAISNFAEAVLASAAAQAQDQKYERRYAQAERSALLSLAIEAHKRAQRRELVRADQAELRRYFDSHRSRFNTDLELDLSVLAVAAAGPSRRVPYEQIRQLEAKIRGGAPFEQVAREFTPAGAPKENPRLGLRPVPQLRRLLTAPVVARASDLKVGELSQPIAFSRPPEQGYMLVLLHQRREPKPRPFEQVQQQVIDVLSRERIQKLDDQLRDATLTQANFEIQRGSLGKYVATL